MKLYIFTFIFHLLVIIIFINQGCNCKSFIPIGYNFTMAIPVEYTEGFSGKAYIMETDQMPLNFRTALTVEAIDGRYACSLEVFLGNVKVWDSSHGFFKFYTLEICMLEITREGDLRLKGADEVIGWRTATSGQGVEKLQLLDSGNLVLVDAQENIKWQTFNFPTNVLLLGQRLSVATHLTSFPTNNYSIPFFSFEIHHDKVALYLNSGSKHKYSYWEFEPSEGRNLTYIDLSSRGLELFDGNFSNFSQIFSPRREPIRFVALDNTTGNLGFYYYNPYKDKFEASFQVLNATCDLPLACYPYGICTSSNTCSCIRLLTREDNSNSNSNSNANCNEGITNGLCGSDQLEMLQLMNVVTSLKNDATSSLNNMSIKECTNSCLNDCECAAALYSSSVGECMLYDIVRGVKEVNRGSGLSYLVKVPKGSINGNHKKSGLRKWVLILIVVIDGLILLMVVGGIGYFMTWKRRRRSSDGNSS